jgi:hypothetical protein
MDVVLTHLLLYGSFGVLELGLVDLEFEIEKTVGVF